MNKKYIWPLITLIVLVAAALGGYFATNKPKTSYHTNASSNSSLLPVNNSIILTKTKSTLGHYLTDPKGNTLYTYSKDSVGVSNCTASCLSIWPAYIDKGAISNLPVDMGVIKRPDNGEYQYTFKGLPLYYYVNDSTGQVTGNGVAGFNVARP